jgi:hypothetical protein
MSLCILIEIKANKVDSGLPLQDDAIRAIAQKLLSGGGVLMVPVRCAMLVGFVSL